jgi:hypothetical protein
MINFSVTCGIQREEAEALFEVYQSAKTKVETPKGAKVFDIRVDNFAPIPEAHRAQFNAWVLTPVANVEYQHNGYWTEKGFKFGGDHDIDTMRLYDFWLANHL